jgi:hypothetical protein
METHGMDEQCKDVKGMFLTCNECLNEMPPSESPSSFMRVNVFATMDGLQVWCVRHDLLILRLDFKGAPVMAVDDETDTEMPLTEIIDGPCIFCGKRHGEEH